MFVSYAQNFEDVLLRRVFRGVTDGFYVDVGAWDPTLDSVTKTFYDLGWTGINVEPSPTFDRFLAARPRDVNLRFAVGEHAGSAPLHVYSAGKEILASSSLNFGDPPKVASADPVHEMVVEVKIVTLAQLLDEHAGERHIHFLKIDAEGSEAAIIRGADWTRHRPEVLVIEATRPGTQERCDDEWTSLLEQSGYNRVWFDGLNAWFLREESKERARAFGIPPNVFDDFKRYDAQAEQRSAAAESWARSLESDVKRLQEEVQRQLRDLDRLSAAENWAKVLERDVARLQEETQRYKDELDRLSAAEDWAQSLNRDVARLQAEIERQNAQIDRLSMAQAWARSLEKDVERLRRVETLAQSLEQDVSELQQRVRQRDDELRQLTHDLERSHAAKVLEEAQTWVLSRELAQAQAHVQAMTLKASALDADLALIRAQLQASERERRALALIKWQLVYDLRMPEAPRALRIVLPLARIIRRVSRHRQAAPEIPPDLLEVMPAAETHSAPRRLGLRRAIKAIGGRLSARPRFRSANGSNSSVRTSPEPFSVDKIDTNSVDPLSPDPLVRRIEEALLTIASQRTDSEST